MRRLLRRLDSYQRRHAWVGFPLAVVKRFGEDRAGQLAALIAYYGFFSLFPLLLVMVTVLGFVLSGNPALQDRVLDSAVGQIPVIGPQIRENIGSISGSGIALGVGIGAALWGGLAGVKAAQNAMDSVWDVPRKRQPNALTAILRSLLMLSTLGVFFLLAAFLGGIAAGTETAAAPLQVLGLAASVLLNLILFWVAFRVLTVAEVSWRDVFPGAVLAAVLWSGLQAVGGYIVGHRLESAGEVYGFFAVVIVLLSWMYLGAQITLVAAEVNVVRTRRLWPRALVSEDMTEADRRALRQHAEVEERRDEEDVAVSFRDEDDDPDEDADREASGNGTGGGLDPRLVALGGAVAGAVATEGMLRRRRRRSREETSG